MKLIMEIRNIFTRQKQNIRTLRFILVMNFKPKKADVSTMELKMKFEEKIAGLCLSGYIQKVKGAERRRCLRAIRDLYGPRVRNMVRRQTERPG
jgi:hypothetical protein